MKKIIALVLCVVLVLSLTGCGSLIAKVKDTVNNVTESTLSSAVASATSSLAPSVGSSSSEAPSSSESSSEASSESSGGVTVGSGSSSKPEAPALADAVVLIDEKDVKISLTKIEYPDDDWYAAKCGVLIENNSDKALTFSTDYTAVNNIMMDSGYLYAKVEPGKKSNETITFYTEDFEKAGIDAIHNMKLVLSAYDDDYDDYIEDTALDLSFDKDMSFQQELASDGVLLFEQEGIKFYVFGASARYEEMIDQIDVLIVNDSNIKISCDVTDTSVNGFMVSGSLYKVLLPKTAYYTEIYFYDDDLEENGIDDFLDAEFKVRVRNYDSYDMLFTTDAYSLEFE